MKILFIFLLLITPLAHSGELYDRFEHQQIIKNGFQDPMWKNRKPKREQKNIEIGFERAVSCRMCQAYSIIIGKDGQFTYQGLYKSKVKGIIKGKVPKKVINKIINYTKTINFFALDNRYSYPRTHASRNYTYVKFNSKYKIIENYMNQAPASVWGLELMLDNIVETYVLKENTRPVVSSSMTKG